MLTLNWLTNLFLLCHGKISKKLCRHYSTVGSTSNFYHSCKRPQREQESYGIDFESMGLSFPKSDGIVVPITECPLSEEAHIELQRCIDPKQLSVNHGVDIYLNTVAFVMEHVDIIEHGINP